MVQVGGCWYGWIHVGLANANSSGPHRAANSSILTGDHFVPHAMKQGQFIQVGTGLVGILGGVGGLQIRQLQQLGSVGAVVADPAHYQKQVFRSFN